MKFKQVSSCFAFSNETESFTVRLFKADDFVEVSMLKGGMFEVIKTYKVLDKSLQHNATHALRILRYALKLDDMPTQHTVHGDRPCLQLVRK